LGALPGTRVRARSHDYATPPWGVTEQPDFINAVVLLDTQLGARALLDAMLTIERDHGRRRDGPRWGPRTLDLDVLLYGDTVMAAPELVLPHPRIAERAFVLLPLAELAPRLAIPGQGRVGALLKRVDCAACRKLE
ncbi:MAG TPA: 2-amino-4-hydroxy-6-hydroxymethyldihydropteridine diphosphokinase, partial [Rhodanobacteraceae bacterium]|nr:2-amino-4-hydroxy-6-hydroxymethyldihydropteridine diphosphokinase [Rhodanobacteraceae bacterium]